MCVCVPGPIYFCMSRSAANLVSRIYRQLSPGWVWSGFVMSSVVVHRGLCNYYLELIPFIWQTGDDYSTAYYVAYLNRWIWWWVKSSSSDRYCNPQCPPDQPSTPHCQWLRIPMRFHVQLFKARYNTMYACGQGHVFFNMCQCNYYHPPDTSDRISTGELFIKHVVNSMRPNYVCVLFVPPHPLNGRLRFLFPTSLNCTY